LRFKKELSRKIVLGGEKISPSGGLFHSGYLPPPMGKITGSPPDQGGKSASLLSSPRERMSEKALLVRGKYKKGGKGMIEKEVLYQKFIRKPLDQVVKIFERQNPALRKQTRVIEGRLEVVFTSYSDIKRRVSKKGFEVGLLRYVFIPEGQNCFLEVRREWIPEDKE